MSRTLSPGQEATNFNARHDLLEKVGLDTQAHWHLAYVRQAGGSTVMLNLIARGQPPSQSLPALKTAHERIKYTAARAFGMHAGHSGWQSLQ